MRTLVTGATGLLGSRLVHHLLDAGTPVRILRRSTSALDLLGSASQHVEHALGDVTDFASVARALDGVTHVYHAAAALGDGTQDGVAHMRSVNVEGTANVVDAAREAGVERLVHTSSMAAFGRPNRDAALDETALWVDSPMNSPYARSKHLAEREVYRAIAEGLDAVLVNPGLIFGPGRAGDNTMQIIEQVAREKLPAAPSGGTNVVDVEDVAAGHLLAMAHGRTGERYFLGGDNLAWTTILRTVADAFGVQPPRRVLRPRPAVALAMLSEAVAFVTRQKPLITRERARLVTRTYSYSSAKAEAALGYTHRPFAETAQRIAAMQG